MSNRVLVTDGDQRAALAVVRSLARAGCDVLVCARQAHALAGASRHCRETFVVPDPLHSPQEFGESVGGLVSEQGIDALIPVTEAALLAVLPLRERMAGVKIPFPDLRVFEQLIRIRAHEEDMAHLA
ncbi:MAG: hypothetical protein IIC93_06395, partial [Chloroflexi bacterium]|nr:hypothetical protein [Chloroflexota bacterium]